MRGSKYRIRKGLEQIQAIKLRRILDPSGDTGCFLLTTFATPEQARAVNQALRAEGIGTFPQGLTNVMMTEWGLHIYYNIPSLVHKTSIDKGRFPWALTENRESRAEYSKGTCPQADSLFERTMLLAIPSNLAISDEEDIVAAFRKVVPVVADCATVKAPGA
jgi:8-amino-3,8-dideoxy-alpha-D-manno-octulosonate transaminase